MSDFIWFLFFMGVVIVSGLILSAALVTALYMEVTTFLKRGGKTNDD